MTADRRIPAVLPGLAVLVPHVVLRGLSDELWLDEAFTRAATHDLVDTLGQTGATMGLYYSALTPWEKLNGSVEWLRLPSLVAMCLALVVLCALVERIAGWRAAVAAGVLAAVLPSTVTYAGEARSYAAVCFVSMLAWYAVDRDLERPGRWRWIAAGCIVALPLLHGLAPIQSVLLASVTAWAARGDRRARATASVVAVATALSGLIVGGLMLMGAGEVGNWLGPLSAEGTLLFLRTISWPNPALAIATAALAVIGCHRCLIGTIAGVGDRGASKAIDRFRRLVLPAAGPTAIVALLVLSVIRPSHLGRYSLVASLALAALVAVAVEPLLADRRTSAVLLVILVSMVSISIPPKNTAPWSTAGGRIAAEAEPGDQLIFGRPDARIPFEAQWMRDGREPLEVVGPGAPLGEYDRFVTAGTEEILTDIDEDGRVWLLDQAYLHQDGMTGELRSGLRDLGFEVVEHWRFPGDITVSLWDRGRER